LRFGFHGQCWIEEEPHPLTAFIALLSFGMVDIVQKDQVWIKKEQSARSDFCFLPKFLCSKLIFDSEICCADRLKLEPKEIN
jgi:hypothetical protein